MVLVGGNKSLPKNGAEVGANGANVGPVIRNGESVVKSWIKGVVPIKKSLSHKSSSLLSTQS